MKLIYTHENRFFVSNAKNILENAGVSVYLKNEYAAGAAGDLSPFDAWLELWVLDDEQYEKAISVIQPYKATWEKSSRDKRVFGRHDNSAADWLCQKCHEKNDPSFELCWYCHGSGEAQ